MAEPRTVPFVKFSNELLDAVIRSPMDVTHKEVLLAVLRLTDGELGRAGGAQASISLLEQKTGRNRSGLKDSVIDHIREGVLVEVSPPSYRKARVLRVNKDYEKWGRYSVRQEDIRKRVTTTTQVEQTSTGEVDPAPPREVGQGHPTIDNPLDKVDIPSVAAKHLSAQQVVSHAAALAAEQGLTVDGSWLGHLGREAKKLLNAGADSQQVLLAAEEIVLKNKSPQYLGFVLRDLQGMGQPQNGAASKQKEAEDVTKWW